jgi:hypothetical protein
MLQLDCLKEQEQLLSLDEVVTNYAVICNISASEYIVASIQVKRDFGLVYAELLSVINLSRCVETD